MGRPGGGRAAHLYADAVVHAQPEEQQGAQEQRLEEVVQRAQRPAVHQEGEGEERVWRQSRRPGEERTERLFVF